MPNGFKYNASSESLALKEGNFYMSTNDVGKGPTSTTGFYNGITPPAGGYSIYLNKESSGPSIYVAYSDSELLSLTNKIAGTNYTTVNECLNYYITQSDKVIINKDYPAIVTDGLVLNLDASFTPSYPKNGTTWYDTSSGGSNRSLSNGPTFSTDNGGCIVFDGVDDYTTIPVPSQTTGSICFWYYYNANTTQKLIMGNSNSMIYCGGGAGSGHWFNGSDYSFSFTWPNVSQWLYMCATYESTTNNKFYINGSLAYSSTSYSLTKGTTYNVAGNYYTPQSCKFSSIHTYNRALSASEVLRNYNATAFLGSQFNPANSAAAILSVNPSATDGYYWINTSLGPRQLYCIMSQGGWMGVTSELSPQIYNVSTSASWETNTNRRLQSGNSQILNVTVQESGCGSPTLYQLRSPSVNGLYYTQTMLLIQRISTIGQCSYISDTVNNGYYTGPEYTGSYTSSAMCTWGDGLFANACCGAQNMTNLKTYWVLIGSGNNSNLTYQVQCAGGSGQHYHMWFVK